MELIILIGVVVVIALVYAVHVYNTLQTLKTRIIASIQEIGNQLKRQASLIPNLQESAKAFLKQETGIFQALTDARKSVDTAVKSGDLSQMSSASEQLSSLLPKIQVLVESNPEIKSSEIISKLMNELRDTSDKVMYSRRTLIDLTADYNMMLVTFPSNIIANSFGFKSEKGLNTPTTGEHLEVSKEDTLNPQIKL